MIGRQGRHSSSRRFLAECEFKVLMAYVLCNWDLKFSDSYEGRRPPNRRMSEVEVPPEEVKVYAKRRKAE